MAGTARVDRLTLLFGCAHFLVDFTCALMVVSLPYRTGVTDDVYYPLVIGYNLLAFGGQPLCGWLLDRRQAYRAGVVAGLVTTGLGALAATIHPVLAVLLLGTGNALFHVGAGALVYLAAPGRAAGPGLFVAPGGVGLAAGILLGLRDAYSPLWLLFPLGAAACLAHILSPPGSRAADGLPVGRLTGSVESGSKAGAGAQGVPPRLPLLLLLFLVVVSLRSFSGFGVPGPWKGSLDGVALLALASFAGKASGGYLADRAGWRPLCLGMLLVSAVAGMGHTSFLAAACLTLFCMQATTGVTLAGVQSLFPGRPGFAFGLPCLALIAGAAPFFLPQPLRTIPPEVAGVVSLLAALAIAAAAGQPKPEVY